MDDRQLKIAVLNHLMSKMQDDDLKKKFPGGKRPVMSVEKVSVEPASDSEMNDIHDGREEGMDEDMGEHEEHPMESNEEEDEDCPPMMG